MDRQHLIRDVVEQVLQRFLHHHFNEGIQVRVEFLVSCCNTIVLLEEHVQRERERTALSGFHAQMVGWCTSVQLQANGCGPLHFERARIAITFPFADPVLW